MSRKQQLLVLGLICLGGLAIHFAFYLRARPMWGDEVTVGLNVMEKSYAALAGRLDAALNIPNESYAATVEVNKPFGGYGMVQVEPVVFLWLGKLAITLGGLSVKSFQFVPLAAYGAFLVLAAWWLSRAVAFETGAVCLAIMAVAAPMIEYSTEFKKYSTELLWSLVALALFFPDGNPVKLTLRRSLVLAILGALLIWCSLSMIFVLAGIVAPLAFAAFRGRNWRALSMLAIVGGACLLSFGVEYGAVLHNPAVSGALHDFPPAAFVPLPPKSPADLMWYVNAFLEMFEFPLGFDPFVGGLCGVAFLLGVRDLWQRNRPLAAALLGPFVVTFAAAQLHQYPWGGRTLLFLAFDFAGLLAVGLVALVRILAQRSRVAAIGSCSMLTIALLLPAQREFKRFSPDNSYRKNLSVEGVAAQIQRDLSPYDCVYLLQTSAIEFKFYSLIHHYRWEKELLVGRTYLSDEQPEDLPRSLNALAADIEKAVQHRRAWIILSEHHWLGLKESYIERLLDQKGRQVKRVSERGAVGLLYDFSQGPSGERPGQNE